MIFQYQYKRLGTLYSVDHYAGSNPEALDFCGTTVYPVDVMFAFQANATRDGNLDIEFVDLDQEQPA